MFAPYHDLTAIFYNAQKTNTPVAVRLWLPPLRPEVA